MTPYLTDEHIAHLTHPLKQPAARVRALRERGFHVIVLPNGQPSVSLANYNRVTGGEPEAVTIAGTPSTGFDETKLRERYGKTAKK